MENLFNGSGLKKLLTVLRAELNLSANPPKLLLIKLPAFDFRRQPTQEDDHGADSNHHPNLAVAWGNTILAAQSQLGLRTKRRARFDPRNRAHSIVAQSVLT